jgi:hypothetical protein
MAERFLHSASLMSTVYIQPIFIPLTHFHTRFQQFNVFSYWCEYVYLLIALSNIHPLHRSKILQTATW